MLCEFSLDTMNGLDFSISPACIIFLYGDLGAGKTTLSKEIISRYTLHNYVVTSPTYVYYNRYEEIYHFDLYRMRDYDEFVSIGGEEILDNNTGIVIIEWPEMLEQFYIPDIIIRLDRTEIEGIRKIEIIYKKNNTILPQHF